MTEEKIEKPKELDKEEVADKIKSLNSWINTKEVQIHAIKNNIAIQEFKLDQIKENVKDGWFIKDKEKQIKEAQTTYQKKVLT